MSRNWIVVVLIVCSLCSYAQSNSNCGEYSNKKAIKKFEKLRDKEYPLSPIETIKKMKELQDKYSDFPELIAFIAEHYHHSAYKKRMNPNVKARVRANAKKWFEKLESVCPSYQGHLAYYWLGRMNHEDDNDSIGAFYFKKYLENEAEPPKEYKKIAQNLVDEYFAKERLLANPVPFNPKRVKGVSTEHDEYLPMLSPDNEWVYFTRKRNTAPDVTLPPNSPGNDDKEYFSQSKAITVDSFTRGMALGKPFNQHLQPILDVSSNNKLKGLGGACLTPDNKTMYLTANLYIIPLKGGGFDNTSLMMTEYKQGKWSPLRSLGGVNDENGERTWEGQPTVSSDGKLLVFASARESSVSREWNGNEYFTMDLFYCIKNEDGSWGEPKNMGELINTKGNEKTPFLHTDSRTLYFASNGHPGMGGYDIYFTRMDVNGNWTKPTNIGFPINTEKDEHGLIVSLDGKTAFFTSGEQGNPRSGGLDLVSFPLYEKARPEKVAMMKGTLKDENGAPIKNGKISVTNKKTGEVHEGLVDEETGDYVVVVPVEDSNKPKVQPTKVKMVVNGEEVEVDYGSKVEVLNGKEVIIPPGGKIVKVNKKKEVLKKDEVVALVNGKEEIIKKSDKVRKIDGVDVVVPSDHEIVDLDGEAMIVPKKNASDDKKEKQRLVVNATGDNAAFSTAVVEVDPDSIDGAKKIYAEKPIEIQTLAKNKPIRLNEVNFATNSAVLNGKSMDILDELVTFLKLKSTMKIAIHGHTDNRGAAQENLVLSRERAKSVTEFLIQNGISSDRLSYKGFGQTKPKASNSTEKGRAINRRVEFVILSY